MNIFIYENTYGDYEGCYDVKHFFHTEKNLDSLICFIHEKAVEHFNLYFKDYWKSEKEFIARREKQEGSHETFNPLKIEDFYNGEIQIDLVDALKMNLEKDFYTLEVFLKKEFIEI